MTSVRESGALTSSIRLMGVAPASLVAGDGGPAGAQPNNEAPITPATKRRLNMCCPLRAGGAVGLPATALGDQLVGVVLPLRLCRQQTKGGDDLRKLVLGGV